MSKPILNIHHLRKRGNTIGRGEWYVSPGFICCLEAGRYNKKTGKEYYSIDFIKTEKEFVLFIKNYLIEELGLFDYGRFTVISYVKGRTGSYVFWTGEIQRDYWIFFEHKSLTKFNEKEIRRYEEEISKANSIDEVNSLKQEISGIKDDAKLEKSFKRYGFYPFLTPSSKRGRINYWNDIGINIANLEEQEKEKQELGVQNFSKKRANKKLQEMSLEEINTMTNDESQSQSQGYY